MYRLHMHFLHTLYHGEVYNRWEYPETRDVRVGNMFILVELIKGVRHTVVFLSISLHCVYGAVLNALSACE